MSLVGSTERLLHLEAENALLNAALREIRDLSLTWALACPCDCEICSVLFERIRDAVPQEAPQSGE